MPAALKRMTKDGTLYQRPPEIEALIEALEPVEANARLLRFDGIAKKRPEYVPTEVLLHFLRRAWAMRERGSSRKFFVSF